ncbi:SAM-dependent methyltransferase [Virgibacillus indicus]|uniref:SAM-dependent methyltransferase n=1 Tax=Virgibacillus indicus TaxID=2024554 RepID=A0A265NCE6_9BACI|nr:class I SAM-dependent methyltransferase [Virgibacillus indicus]OZU89134.1 SAM-dependent methyltransferase [Virgibacillus indicus]
MSFNWSKEAQKQWDNRAGFWNEKSAGMWDSGSRKEIIPFIEKHLEKGSSILDIGCGDGYGTQKLHKAGYNATGVDISREMISLASKLAENKPISFFQADINDMSFEGEGFDGIMCINVLEWTEDPHEALRNLSNAVKKDGLLCIGLLGPTAGPRTNSYPRLHGNKTICNTMMPWEFKQLASESNLNYLDGFGVYKKGVEEQHYKGLPIELKQALTFMWVFMLQKVGE